MRDLFREVELFREALLMTQNGSKLSWAYLGMSQSM